MQRSQIVSKRDGKVVIFIIPYGHRVHEQVYQQPTEIFILNISILELLQPVDDLGFFQIHYILFLIAEFSFKDFLFLLQLYHALDQRFWGKSRLNSFGQVLKGYPCFMQSATEGRNVGCVLHLLRVGANCHVRYRFNVFIREQGHCIADYYSRNQQWCAPHCSRK